MSDFKTCPSCNGKGSVVKPPWLSEDQNSWTGSMRSYLCGECNGLMVINKKQKRNYIKVVSL